MKGRMHVSAGALVFGLSAVVATTAAATVPATENTPAVTSSGCRGHSTPGTAPTRRKVVFSQRGPTTSTASHSTDRP